MKRNNETLFLFFFWKPGLPWHPWIHASLPSPTFYSGVKSCSVFFVFLRKEVFSSSYWHNDEVDKRLAGRTVNLAWSHLQWDSWTLTSNILTLSGHEFPFSIKMSHIRDGGGGGGKDAVPSPEGQGAMLLDQCLPPDTQCQFILKSSRVGPKQALLLGKCPFTHCDRLNRKKKMCLLPFALVYFIPPFFVVASNVFYSILSERVREKVNIESVCESVFHEDRWRGSTESTTSLPLDSSLSLSSSYISLHLKSIPSPTRYISLIHSSAFRGWFHFGFDYK